jgi:hypothetical protein
MADFLTGKQLDEKLTDIIWKAKKELIILSPFIRLDEYCKNFIFKKLKNKPELEIVIVFGKNEGETQRSLNHDDLEFFKDFSNIVIIYCVNLHAKFYANESEALLTSLNLLGKSMTDNVEYGISFPNSKLTLEKLYDDSIKYTDEVIISNPCVFVKRPIYKKTNLGLSRKYLESKVLFDMTDALYKNRSFEKKLYKEFETELFDSDIKLSREEFAKYGEPENSHRKEKTFTREYQYGYCIRTGVRIPFNPEKPLCYDAYIVWAEYGNENFRENFCHKTGEPSNGKTSFANPILRKNI